jgi:membrane glycosyltransferase
MMMIQHLRAVIRTFAGFDTGWAPHQQGRPRLSDLFRFHAVETVTGLCLIGFASVGYLSLWLVPTAVCLAFAAPLAWTLALDARGWPLFRFGKTAQTAAVIRLQAAS